MVEEKIINGVKIYKTQEGERVKLDDQNIEGCIAVLRAMPIRRIIISDGLPSKPSYNLDNLDFLEKIDFEIEEIRALSSRIKNWKGIYSLPNLKILMANWLANIELDFAKIIGLKELWIDWNKKQKNLFVLKNLEELHLWKYINGKENLDEFQGLQSLNTLEIVQSDIKSIKGAETLKHLKTLSFSYNKNLEINYGDFLNPLNNIKELHIEVCKRVNLDFIKLFPKLEKLEIVNNGKIQSLRPILDGLPKLKEIFIGETLIEETDNEYYKDYSNIKKFFFSEKRHHKLKMKDLSKW